MSYKLDGVEGTRFYKFDQERSDVEASSGVEDKKRLGDVKDWFRRGMDEGVCDDQKLKGTLVHLTILNSSTDRFHRFQPT